MTDPERSTTIPPHAPQARTTPTGDGRQAGVQRGESLVAHPSAASADRGPEALAPREEALLEDAVTIVRRRDRGPLVAASLIVAAFLLGLFRPWDLLGPPAAIPAPDSAPVSGDVAAPSATARGIGTVFAQRTEPPAPHATLTCALPMQWRSSTIEEWTGHQARVWKAVDVVEAAGPSDPAIQFEPIVAATITAIGWCAPAAGPERPPLDLVTTLYRIGNGVASAIPYDRLEPAAPDALGELWVPRARSVGQRPRWPMGRYVIELRSPSGTYTRYLGLDLTDHVARAGPAASAEPAPAIP